LTQGDYDTAEVFSDDPVAAAATFAAAGARRLHVVDLDAARGGGANIDAIQAVIASTEMNVDVGGGIRDAAGASRWLRLGAAYVVLGTVAAENPDVASEIARQWPGKVLVGLDTRGQVVATRGWEHEGDIKLPDLVARYDAVPIAGFVYTAIERDGALEGPDLTAVSELIAGTKHTVILSGGVSNLGDLRGAERVGAAGAIVGRALYQGSLDLREALEEFPPA
jgi:phosphoribosylformimino-5-aminoimidazole carboxamide ribotide isomerase